jgi:hypothetical protein
MGKMPWVTYLWPGLSLIWRYGSWLGLAIAVGFTALVNLALAASILWSELFPAGLRSLIWAVVGGVWVISAILASRWDSREARPQNSSPREDPFALAMDHYLKGNWFEAEYLLSGLLAACPRDVDASLMLVTLWRHTGRFEEALDGLARLERCQDAEKWRWEIGRERDLVCQAQKGRGEPDPAAATGVTASAAGRAEAA